MTNKRRKVKAPAAGAGAAPASPPGNSVPASESQDIINTEFDSIIESTAIILASELPDEFEGSVERVYTGINRWGNKVIKFRIALNDGSITVISYPKTVWPDLIRRLKDMGFNRFGEIEGYAFRFRRKRVGRLIYPRHIPVEVIEG